MEGAELPSLRRQAHRRHHCDRDRRDLRGTLRIGPAHRDDGPRDYAPFDFTVPAYQAHLMLGVVLAQLPQFEGPTLGKSGTFSSKLALHFAHCRRRPRRFSRHKTHFSNSSSDIRVHGTIALQSQKVGTTRRFAVLGANSLMIAMRFIRYSEMAHFDALNWSTPS